MCTYPYTLVCITICISPDASIELWTLNFKLKPGLSTKILSINDFITKILSKLLRDLFDTVHLKSINKFINKVINT